MSTALDYVEAGLVLVPIPAGTKGPTSKGWNQREHCITSIEGARAINGGNLGLAHAYSHTCAVDIDQLDKAVAWLWGRDVDLVGLLMDDDAVQIVSGRENRAKLIYRLPLPLKPLPSKSYTDDGDVINFRCSTMNGLTVQDVLPPSIHPDTRKPYTWRGDWRNIPFIPQALLDVWFSLLGDAGAGDHEPPEPPDDWVSVNIWEIEGLSKWSRNLILNGDTENKYPSRSEAIFGILKDLIRAGVDDDTICRVMVDPANRISEKALENAHGDIHKAMQWIAGQIWKARDATEKDQAKAEQVRNEQEKDRKGDTAHKRAIHAFIIPHDFDPATIPPRRFLYERHLMRKTVAGMVSPGGVGKSVMSMLMGLCVASGRELIGDRVYESCNVLMLNNEDEADELKRRQAAILQQYGLPFSETQGMHLVSGYGNPYLVAHKLPNGEVVAAPEVEGLIDYVREHEIGLLIVDPFISTHNVSENSNEEVDRVISQYKHIAAETGCAILLVHHTKKSGNDTEAHAGDSEAGRGASSMKDACRITFTLARMSRDTAKKLGIDWAIANRLIRRDDAKMNFSLRDEDATWFYLESVALPNSDWVGVPITYSMAPYVEAKEEKIAIKATDVALEVAKVMGKESRMSNTDIMGLYRKHDDVSDSMRWKDLAMVPIGEEQALQITVKGELCRIWRERKGGDTGPIIFHKEVLG